MLWQEVLRTGLFDPTNLTLARYQRVISVGLFLLALRLVSQGSKMPYGDYSPKVKKQIKETTLGRTKNRSVRLVYAGLDIGLPRPKIGSLRLLSQGPKMGH